MYFRTHKDYPEGIVIKKGGRYFEILSGQYLNIDEIQFSNLNHEGLNDVLQLLKENHLDYFVKGFNNNLVCTKNITNIVRTIDGYKINGSVIGRTKGVYNKTFVDIHNNVVRLGAYSIWRADFFFNIISQFLKDGNIVQKNDVVRRKQNKSKGGVSPMYKHEKKIFISVVEKILDLSSKFDDDSQLELGSMLSRYKFNEMIDIYNSKEIDEKLSCIWKENNYKILTFFKY